MMTLDFLILACVFIVIWVCATASDDSKIIYISFLLAVGFLAMFLVRIVPQLWQYASSL